MRPRALSLSPLVISYMTCPTHPADANSGEADPEGRVAVATFLVLLLPIPIPSTPTTLDKLGENPTACRARSAMQVDRNMLFSLRAVLSVLSARAVCGVLCAPCVWRKDERGFQCHE